MKTLLKRVALGLLAALACGLAAPAMAAVDCSTATTPQSPDTNSRATFEVLQKLCAQAAAPTPAAPLSYTAVAGSPVTLTSSWTKVATTTTATRALLISDVTGGAYDIRWTSVAANAAAPSAGEPGQNVFGGENFPGGLPIGDLYLKSASGAQASVYVGN